jgi:hypothetical protein
MDRMVFPAVPVQHIFLSAPATIVFLHHQCIIDPRKTLQLALLAGYQTGICWMFWLGMKYMDKLVMSDDPALVYYQKAMHNVDKLIGDPIVGWINPSVVKFSKVYLDASGKKMNGDMDQMIDDLILLLEWINDNVRTDNFNHSAIEARFHEALAGWKDFGTGLA